MAYYTKTKIFVSFDFDNDQDLKNLFCGQAAHNDTHLKVRLLKMETLVNYQKIGLRGTDR
jgi:hypothetical protein